jgi:hypothetical protein
VAQAGNRAVAPVSGPGTTELVVVPLALFALAATLGAGLWRFSSPVAPATNVPQWATDIATIRKPSLQPQIDIVGYTYHCSTCHRLFPARTPTGRSLTQHRDIVLKHGINDRCLNCHHPSNRDAFANDTGGEIPYDQPQLLCAKCHGPVYRDWSHGVHGRTNGYWDRELGPSERKLCTECHDPHVPPFPPMRPAPGPNTLRMGDQRRFHARYEGQENPLLIYQKPTDPDEVGGEEHE